MDLLNVSPQENAFLHPDGLTVFSSVVQTNEIWRQDPFDVESIHAEARQTFYECVGTMLPLSAKRNVTGGKTFLLLGESGAGKTHLMRAFRNYIHSNDYGYFAYMQMTAPSDNYERYILHNLINSLDQPYYAPDHIDTCLDRIFSHWSIQTITIFSWVPQITCTSSRKRVWASWLEVLGVRPPRYRRWIGERSSPRKYFITVIFMRGLSVCR